MSTIPSTKGFPTVPRSLPTGFLEEWASKREEARRERDRLRGQVVFTTQAGRQHECALGRPDRRWNQVILPVAVIIRRLREYFAAVHESGYAHLRHPAMSAYRSLLGAKRCKTLVETRSKP